MLPAAAVPLPPGPRVLPLPPFLPAPVPPVPVPPVPVCPAALIGTTVSVLPSTVAITVTVPPLRLPPTGQ